MDDDHVRLVLLHMARLDRGALMRSLAILVAALSIGVANADDSTAPAGIAQQPDYLIAKQGNADVWAIDVDAHLASMPPKDRSGFIDSPKRIQQLLSHLLLRRGLANEAREHGLDKDPVVQRELLQAAEVVLMRHQLDYVREHTDVPDLEQLAKEKYLADRDTYKTGETVTVAHILLDTTKRTDAEAKALLLQWKADIAAGKATIEDLAKANSDDPGVSSNNGLYENYDPNKFVPEFAVAVHNLVQPGDLSDPVKTEFGYHLIQLRSRTPGKPYTWDEIKDQMVANERDKFQRKVQADHIDRLKSLPVEASEESVAPLRERYGKVEMAPAPAVPAAIDGK
ncbi:MAG: peptidylprolyl isomerase [Rhodanobacteraceae bacterium]|nr:peptidylprolyl isomerase [Rhodanobacteraceae bacterium]